jgi:hypothetical protein
MLLQTLPAPGSAVGASAFTQLPPAASLAQVLNLITQYYGAAKAANFLLWYNAAKKQDPSLTPLNGWAIYITGGTIASGLGTATGALATIPGAAAQGANNAYKDIIGQFNLGGWFLRVGEILLGLVLVGVGIAKITGVSNVISTAVKAKIP